MAHLNAEFWAFPFDVEPVPLPHARKWTISPRDDEAGLVELTYPAAGRNYDRLAAVIDDDVDLEVEVIVRGAEGGEWVDRAILDEADLDDVEETGIGTFRGLFLSRILDEVVLPYHPTGDKGNTVVTGTAGRIARELLQAAQARGALAGVTWTFTDSHDSNGVPWERTAVLTFSPGQTYRAVLGTVRGYQLGEWSLTAGRELRLANIDGNGVDRTVGPDPLTLEHGRDLADAPRKWRLRGAITDLVSSGKDGIYAAAGNPTARARRRRRVEGYRSFGNTTDQGTLDALTQADLNTKTAGRTEVSHKLALGPGHPTPLIDFRTADYVNSATRRGVDRRRVRQITVEGDDAEVVAASVTMGVLIDEAAVRQQEQIDALTSGESLAGTSVPPPDVDDGSIPDSPDGLVATSLWFSNNEGAGEASVTAVWSPVPDARVDGYIVEWRYLNSELGDGFRRMPQTDATTLSWSAMSPGQGVEIHVAAINRWGRLSEWSPPYQFATETDGTAPAVPSAVAPFVEIGFIVVPWDGQGSAGEPMPGDFQRAEVHRSTTTGFTPDRPLDASGRLDEAASTTYRGELRGATQLADESLPGDREIPASTGNPGQAGALYYYRLVAVDRTGNASAASAQAQVMPRGVQGDELESLSVSKLRAGVIRALVGIGDKLYAGTPGGAGWEGDAAGFRFYSMMGGTRTAVLEFIASTAQLLITGTFQTGRAGRRAMLSGADNSLRFYPSNDETRWAFVKGYIPDNYPDSVALDVSSSSVPGLDRVTRAYVSPEQAGLSVTRPNDTIATFTSVRVFRDVVEAGVFDSTQSRRYRGGLLSLNRFNSADGYRSSSFNHFDDGGGLKGRCEFYDTGEVILGNGTGSFIRIKPNNAIELVTPSGFTTGNPNKTFVIDHPLDDPAAPRRWLVHACTESPVAAVEYTGTVDVVNGRAVVELPDYFEALVEDDGRTVQLTAVDDDGELFLVAASLISDGRFTVRASTSQPVQVQWHARGARRGQQFDTEPDRDDYTALGDGPYRYLIPRAEVAAPESEPAPAPAPAPMEARGESGGRAA